LELLKLDLSGPEISDEVFDKLRNLRLNELHCYGIRRTKGGINALKSFRGLYDLSLFKTPYSDDDISVLKDLPDLHFLRLDDTEITDASLKTFRMMPKLSLITTSGTKMSKEGNFQLDAMLLENFNKKPLTPPAAKD
jgi:hypothetical protein